MTDLKLLLSRMVSRLARPGCGAAILVSAVAVAAPGGGGLAWDAVVQEHHAAPGEAARSFTFAVSNPSAADVVVESVAPSCGCTVVQLPPLPWTLRPGERGRIEAKMDWTGRFGLFTKTIAVKTNVGVETLTLKIEIPPPEKVVAVSLTRARNLQLAAADRQAVFRGECAKCHAAPAAGQQGEALFAAACAICHEAAHRATLVPDLGALPAAADRAFWRQAVAHGKPGSLMPAFAPAEGGPLSEPQIDSLVEYLTARFARDAAPASPAAK